jgi:hypothetical protein
VEAGSRPGDASTARQRCSTAAASDDQGVICQLGGRGRGEVLLDLENNQARVALTNEGENGGALIEIRRRASVSGNGHMVVWEV